MKPNSFIVSSILPACSRLGALEHGKKIHAYVAFRLLDEMKSACLTQNVVTWSSIIVGYA